MKELPQADIHRNQYVRWAIIQHYEICPTPLLDLTQSLQSALSFAIGDGRKEGYLFVLAFPHLTGPVSVSVESMTQTIDLTQLCPPEALRPHFQSGVLVGDFPSFESLETTHGGEGMIGNNFSCRLLTKFHLANCASWRAEGFTSTPQAILFPNDRDRWFSALRAIKSEL